MRPPPSRSSGKCVAAPDGLWILDTSVATAWFFTDEPLRRQALAVRRHIRDEPDRFIVPHLFLSELIHVLARKSGRDHDFVESALQLVIRLGLRTIHLRERALFRVAHWTCRGLSGYDATFVAVAEDLEGRWLTADHRAAKVAGRERAEGLRAWARARPSSP